MSLTNSSGASVGSAFGSRGVSSAAPKERKNERRLRFMACPFSAHHNGDSKRHL